MLLEEGVSFLWNLCQGQGHTSPCVRKLAISAPFTAFSISQSEKMTRGDLPPSSKVTGLIPLADISMILQNKNKHIRKWKANKTACYRPLGPESPGISNYGRPAALLLSVTLPFIYLSFFRTLKRIYRTALDILKREFIFKIPFIHVSQVETLLLLLLCSRLTIKVKTIHQK